MTRVTWQEFEKLAKSFFEAEYSTTLLAHMPVELPGREAHKFDLVSGDEQVVIECKSHKWTGSGNYPSAKVTDAQRSIELLHKCRAVRKMIAFQDDEGPKGTLVEVFVRRNKALLSGIEVWRYFQGKFEKFAAFPPPVGKDQSPVVQSVVDAILEAFSDATSSHQLFPLLDLAAIVHLGPQELRGFIPEICDRLGAMGMRASLSPQGLHVQTDVLGALQ